MKVWHWKISIDVLEKLYHWISKSFYKHDLYETSNTDSRLNIRPKISSVVLEEQERYCYSLSYAEI